MIAWGVHWGTEHLRLALHDLDLDVNIYEEDDPDVGDDPQIDAID